MFQKVFEYAGPHKKGLYTATAVVLVSVLMGVIPFILAYQVIAPLVMGKTIDAAFIILRVVLVLLCLVLQAIFYGWGLNISHKAAYDTLLRLRTALQKRFEKLPLGVIQDKGTGTVKKLFVDDVDSLEVLLAHSMPEGIANLMIPLAVYVAMFFVDWKLALLSGKHLTGTVIYGYLWDEKREHWLVDEEAAEVVRRIFSLTMEGYGPYQISKLLSEAKVEIPAVHLARFHEGVNRSKPVKDPYGWGSSTIVNILKKREYLGHTINFKTRKHFKDKKSHYVDESEWTIFENTHEAIIDQETFDNVQRIRANVRRYPDGWGEAHPLTGLMYCADCGGKMYVHRVNNGKRDPQFTCSQYSKYPIGSLCPTQHRIKAEAVLTLIADMLRAIAEYSKNDRAEFIRTVQETQAAQQTADISKKRKRLAAAQKRAGELEKLICKIYEDNALGKLPDARYEALDAQYAKEQDALHAEIAELEKAVTGYEQSRKSAEKFIALIDKYENFDTLTNTMLNEFVEKILVHERARKGSQDTTQEVEIYFNFVGRYIPPALQPVPLTPEEQEELRKKEERKDRLHQNYLRRKANGKQKEWEERYNARRKAQVEAAKAAIRAEDMEKGIFTTVSQLPRQEPRKAALPASAAV